MIKKIFCSIPYALITILIIASFLRLYNLTLLPPGLYPDEAMNGNNAQEALDTGNFKVFYPENFGREGLFINIQALFVKEFGHQPWVLRLPSAIFGILTVLGLYLFTKEAFKNRNIALLSSFLLATSFWHINFSRIGFRAIMAPAFLTWALYLLLKSVNQVKNNYQFWKLEIRNWVLPALAGLLYGLGFHSYIAYRATPLLLFFIGFVYYKNYSNILKNIRIVFGLFILGAVIFGLPLGLYFLENPQDFLGRTVGISIFSSDTPLKDFGFNILKTVGMFNFVGDFNWRHNIAGKPLLFWPVGLMFLIGLITTIKQGFKISNFQLPITNEGFKFPKLEIRNWELVIPLAWLVIAAIPIVISNEGLPHALRSILMAPPVFILAAIGGLKIYEFLKSKLNKTLLLSTCYLLLSLLVFEAYYSYFVTWGQNPNTKPAFAYNDSVIARQLNSLPKEMPKYIIVSDFNGKIERDNPISLQSILFLTDTYTNEKRKEKNFIYITKEQFKNLKLSDNDFVIFL